MSSQTYTDGRAGTPGGSARAGSDYARAAAGTNGEPRSLGDLLREIANDLSRLFRNEIALARAETTEKLNRMVGSVVMIAVGGFLGLAALIYVMQAAVYLLAEVMAPWLAALVVGVVVAAIGFGLIMAGKSRLQRASLTPERTLENVKKDINLAKEQVS